jgi:hypothetical protein
MVLLMPLLVCVEAKGQEKPGKNRNSEDAAEWVAAAGDHFFLTLSGSTPYALVFTTDKGFDKKDWNLKVFVLTKEEAAAAVRVLVECGLWSRPDTFPCINFHRTLHVGVRYQGVQKGAWALGAPDDDVSSLVIIRHLVETSKGERQQALKDWLRHGQDKKPK